MRDHEIAEKQGPLANGRWTLPQAREEEIRVPAGEPGWTSQPVAPAKGEMVQAAIIAASLPVVVAVALAQIRAN